MTTKDYREKLCLYCKAAIFVALFLMPPILVVVYIVEFPRLSSATCEITKLLSENTVEVLIRPDGHDSQFTRIVDAPDTGQQLSQGDQLRCYIDLDDSDTTVKFDSGRTIYVVRITVLSLWFGFTIVLYTWYFCKYGCDLSQLFKTPTQNDAQGIV